MQTAWQTSGILRRSLSPRPAASPATATPLKSVRFGIADHYLAGLDPAVERIVAGMDSDLPVSDVLTMDQVLGKNTFDQSFNATLLTAFATLSLLLAAVGLFGVMSYIAGPSVLGLVVGLAVSLEVGRLIRDLLYEIHPLDPAVFAAVAAVLLPVATFAYFFPARRASPSIQCGH